MNLREWFTRLRRPRAAGTLAPPQYDWFVHHPWLKEAGVTVTAETAPQVSAVYGCCRLIVDSLAPAPIRVMEVQPKGRREVLHDDDVAYTLNWGAPIAKAPDAPTGQAIEEALIWSALLHGDGYAEIQRDGSNKFFALWPIEPDRVTPRRDGAGRLYYEVRQPDGEAARVAPASMFHLRGPSLYGWVGDSIVFRAAKAIGIGQAQQIYRSAYFANGTVISGYLKSPKVMSDPQKKSFGEVWRKKHQGPDKAHGVPVLDQGMEYVPLNHDAQKAQLVEASRFQVQEIARFFGVPTTLLADNEAWTNLSELYLGFYRNALLPWAERFDAEATRKLFPQRNPWREVQHDLTRIVMGSFKDQVAALKEAVGGGLWTRNEAREVFGKNHVGSAGDMLTVDGAPKPLEDVLDPPEPPAAPEAPDEDMPTEPGRMPERMPGERDLARAAVALDRFARRLSGRRADLERNAPERTEACLAEERRRLEPGLLAECRAALRDNRPDFDMRALQVADAVLEGEPPHLAAGRLAT